MESFDLAFLTATEKVQWVDSFDVAFSVMKELLRGGRDVMLWGPESGLLTKILKEELQSIAREPLRDILFYLVPVPKSKIDKEKIWEHFSEIEDGVKSAVTAVRSRAAYIMELVVDKAHSLFINRGDPDLQVMVFKQEWETERALNKLEWAIENRIVERSRKVLENLISDTEIAQDLSAVEMLNLERKIRAFSAEFMVSEATAEADVLLGRLWSYSALTTMEMTGVSIFMFKAEMDNRTCAVCMSMHGVQVEVPQALTVLRNYFEQDAAVIAFPKLADISSRDLGKLSLSTPLHNRCRCDMVPVGTRLTDLRVVQL
jgi:hypothetical protein